MPTADGLVTLVFTDIEGSTHLLRALGARYADVLARHRDLLRAAFAEQGGREVDNQGDAFFFVFDSAAGALRAARSAQRALADHRWPDGHEVRVRMGVHSGSPTSTVEGFVGMDLHRAARIMGAGHGRQVLVSDATRRAAEATIDDDMVLRDLGEHRLKDLDGPEWLFQLVAPDLPDAFPALQTLGGADLPTPATALLGRERELRDVAALFADGIRLVTLTGPGGSGKTRLAVEIAHGMAGQVVNGVFFVSLAPLTDPRLVLPAIAQTLGVREPGEGALVEAVARHLRPRHTVLVLDNFEHVLEAAVTVADLLAAAPRLAILATSRSSLRVSGEHLYPVTPLSVPAVGTPTTAADLLTYGAIALFCERARAARPDFRLTDADAPAVAAICRRLDGLPLALELAAARVNVLPPDALLARLDDRLRLLVGGARNMPDRQQTLRATIDWSYSLLSSEEQVLFARLGVFVDGASLDAAERVCDPDGAIDALESLSSLVDKSLVLASLGDGEPRFGMLETIRQYALERLAADGEAEAATRRHADYFVEYGEAARRGFDAGHQREWVGRLESEHANIRAALETLRTLPHRTPLLRLATAVADYWLSRGHRGDGRAWLEVAADDVGAGPTALRAAALTMAATMAQSQGAFDDAEHLATRALALHEAVGDDRGATQCLAKLAFLASERGDDAATERHLHQALQRIGHYEDRRPFVRSLADLTSTAVTRGDLDRAERLGEELLGLARATRDSLAEGAALQDLGLIALRRGERDEGTAMLLASIEVGDGVGSTVTVAGSLLALAGVVAVQDAHRAARLLAAAHTLFQGVGAVLWSLERDLSARTEAALRAQLGDGEFAAAWQQGRAMTPAEAVTEALGPPVDTPATSAAPPATMPGSARPVSSL